MMHIKSSAGPGIWLCSINIGGSYYHYAMIGLFL